MVDPTLSLVFFFRTGDKMIGFSIYKCGIMLHIYLEYGIAIFETDHSLRVFDKPISSAYEVLKQHDAQHDVRNCDRLDLEIKRIYHTRVVHRGLYNIYRIDIKKRSIYIVERYYKKEGLYDYEQFDSFEDAMAYIYS